MNIFFDFVILFGLIYFAELKKSKIVNQKS